ncbi:Tic22-like family [Synechococcus sp. PCC 7502]|uniref:Tic22 family protein n=1 Tax=Synechococcus sp. PCC 7502 TaxID=1173263 RepID=UPI00029F9C73|nr:Tic22 family protein [Synechococcus sp. PCC 7502]AFY72364.1 Tic22-like family [Synechococcus sp. PCC 7502]
MSKSPLISSIIPSIFSLAITSPLLITANIAPAQALTETQVLERLNAIPVFTITDDKGAPLLGTSNQPGKPKSPQVLLFFLNPTDAQSTLSQFKQSNPTAGSKARIVIGSMNDAYKVIKKNQTNKQIAFQIVPAKASMDSARTILVSEGKPTDKLPNVPVFFATGGKNKDQGLLTIAQNGKQIVPFFFDQKDLQTLIDNAKKQQPDVANTSKIQVTSLFQVLDSMVTTKDKKPKPETEKFTFIPARAALEYVVKNQPPSKK